VAKTTDKQQGAQSRKFVEAARELGCDESEERFQEVVGKLTSAPPARNEPGRGKKPPKS
jgi:hypothetical protein